MLSRKLLPLVLLLPKQTETDKRCTGKPTQASVKMTAFLVENTNIKHYNELPGNMLNLPLEDKADPCA